MKIAKIINNNVVSTCDEEGREIIVMGRGVGFKAKEGSTIDEEKVEKIFRLESQNTMDKFKELLVSLPMEHVQISAEIISYAKEVLNRPINPNVYITLTDHINFALERYLQEERTAYDSPYVFLRIVPPYGHISVQAIAKIARTAIAVAGIEPGGRKQGAHAFRSSLASSMINDNIPYEAVRKILGHTDQNAIRSYARLDMEQLRGYALPVMEATGIFAEFLEGRWSLS